MEPVRAYPPPSDSLIAQVEDALYTDSFTVWLPRAVTLEAHIAAFYTTPLFRAERAVLSFAGFPGRDIDALALARDETVRFAAWTVSDRRATEIILTDASGRTQSWLMAAPENGGTRLWFGSVIRHGRCDAVMAAMIGPHRVYSRALLRAAARRLPVERQDRSGR